MQTKKEYLELAERCRSARLDTRDRTARHYLENLEHSYKRLARCADVLKQSRKVQEDLKGASRVVGGRRLYS
jgi:hypothetical protein